LSDGNRPAQSKHELLSTWPNPEIVCDIAKFIGFAQFYSIYIHHFELCIASLHALTFAHDYTDIIVPIWTTKAQQAFDDMKAAILSNPRLMRFDHRGLVVICTDFSSRSFGYVVCQPGTDCVSEEAMRAYRAGSDFAFTLQSSVQLRLVVVDAVVMRCISTCI
jgi:hypothetical protein